MGAGMAENDNIKLKHGRVDGKNSKHKSGLKRIPKKWRNEIHLVLQANRDLAARSTKKVGNETQEKRDTVILGFFSDLFALGNRIQSIYHIKQKHLLAVFYFLEVEGQSPSTIANKISIMRTFCNWIGKTDMVKDSSCYVKNISSVKRSSVAQEGKSWVGHGVDFQKLLAQVQQKDLSVAMTLELCLAFGLRVREAIMFRPNVEHTIEELISVRDGTKGDRPRYVPIELHVQIDVLTRAKGMADGKTDFIWKRNMTLEQKINRFYTVLKACGITLHQISVSAHGLRHQYMHQSYKSIFDREPPIKGGELNGIDKKDFHLA